MMKRNVIKIGPSTLVISLPLKWAKQFDIKKGDELSVEEQGSVLRVSTEKIRKEKEIDVFLSQFNPIMHRIIGVLYKVGYSKMKLRYRPGFDVIHRTKKKRESEVILKTLDHLTGIDIVEAGDDFIVAEEKAEIEYSEFTNTTKQLFINLLKQVEQISLVLKKKRKDIEGEVQLKERLINQTSDFCLRILNTKGHEEFKKTNFMFELIDGLEAIGDQYFYLYLDYIKNRGKIRELSKNLLSVLDLISEILNEFFELFYNFKIKNIGDFFQKVIDTLLYLNNLEKFRKEELPIILHLYVAINRICDLLEPLVALNFEKIKFQTN